MSEPEGHVAEPFDPRAYTIIIRRIVLDGEPVFHGKVVELPDLQAFEPTHEDAYEFLIDGIQTARAAFDEQGRSFPSPLPDESSEYSGRVTLRMPTWLHAQLDYCAKANQTSLNQYMVTLLSWAVSTVSSWIPQQQPTTATQYGFTSPELITLVGATHVDPSAMRFSVEFDPNSIWRTFVTSGQTFAFHNRPEHPRQAVYQKTTETRPRLKRVAR